MEEEEKDRVALLTWDFVIFMRTPLLEGSHHQESIACASYEKINRCMLDHKTSFGMLLHNVMSKLHTVNGDNPRSCVMQVASAVGQLCHLAIDHFPSLQNGQQAPRLSRESHLLVMECITELLTILQITATAFNIPLLLSVQKKLALNNLKYPAELCKVSANHRVFLQHSCS
jgi:hypothetical protein